MIIDVTPGGAFRGRDHGAGFYLGALPSRRHPFMVPRCPPSRAEGASGGVSLRDRWGAVALTISAQLKTCRVGSGTTDCVSNWVFGDCCGLPSEAPKDERVVKFVGQPAGVVVRQTCAGLQMWQHNGAGIYWMTGLW